MDITCPYCKQTLEGDESLVGEVVRCPGCERSFTIVAEQAPCSSTLEPNPKLTSSDKAVSSNREWWVLSVGIAILAIIVVAVFAVPAYQKHQRDLTARRIMRERQIAEEERKEKLKIVWPRCSEDAEKYLELAFESLFPENEERKDVVTAYRRFEEARKRGCRPANLVLAHISWNATAEDRTKLDKSGLHAKEKSEIIELWKQAAKYSPLAKFELGYYAQTLRDWEGRNNIFESAQFGCGPAIVVTKAWNKAHQKGSKIDELNRATGHPANFGDHLFFEAVRSVPEFDSDIQALCNLELKKEYSLHKTELLRENTRNSLDEN